MKIISASFLFAGIHSTANSTTFQKQKKICYKINALCLMDKTSQVYCYLSHSHLDQFANIEFL